MKISSLGAIAATDWPATSYQLRDFGQEQRLEKWGDQLIIRPDPTAIGQPVLSAQTWQSAVAQYQRGTNAWRIKPGLEYLTTTGQVIDWQHGLRFQTQLFPSKHLGVFPEHASQWQWLLDHPAQRVLNLFAYSGGASLAALKAGAQVTHVDSSYEAIGLARQNQVLSDLENSPCRWIKEDVQKFVAREVRRQSQYDGLILDPPVVGHGAKGENWRADKNLLDLLQMLSQLLSPQPKYLLLNTYALPPQLTNTLLDSLQEIFAPYFSQLETDQLALQSQASPTRLLTTGDFFRFSN